MTSRLANSLILVLFALSQNSQAATAPQSPDQFCEFRKQPRYFLELAYDPLNQLAFANQGGLFGGGVCWWHSLFQRASLYLAVFKPHLPKPTPRQAATIVHSLAAGRKVVEIPGYSNIRDFSRDWQNVIQDKLEEWQMVDGFLKFAWLKGLSGSSVVEPAELDRLMRNFAKGTNQKNHILWSMWQLPGIESHSALLLNIKRSGADFAVEHLDSNFVGSVLDFDYIGGQPSVFHSPYDPFVPYPGRSSDLYKFNAAGDRYCGGSQSQEQEPETLDNGIE